MLTNLVSQAMHYMVEFFVLPYVLFACPHGVNTCRYVVHTLAASSTHCSSWLTSVCDALIDLHPKDILFDCGLLVCASLAVSAARPYIVVFVVVVLLIFFSFFLEFFALQTHAYVCAMYMCFGKLALCFSVIAAWKRVTRWQLLLIVLLYFSPFFSDLEVSQQLA